MFSPLADCGTVSSGQIPANMWQVSGDQLASQSTLSISHFWPELQLADGSYVGTEGTSEGETLGNPVTSQSSASVADINSGGIVWQQSFGSPVLPLYATDDGNVTVSSTQYTMEGTTLPGVQGQLGTLYTLDSGGNIASQTTDTGALPSWINHWYVDPPGTTSSISQSPIHFASTWAAIVGGNHSGTSVAIPQQWFPPLDHCTAAPGCIGHYEAIYNALGDLISRLNNPTVIQGPDGPTTLAALAQAKIFDKLGTDAHGVKLTTVGFVNYLSSSHPRFFEGLTSTYCYESLESPGSWCPTYFTSLLRTTLRTYFAENPSDDAETATPSNPLLTFFNSNDILFNSLGQNVENESVIFHEALHGLTGLPDRGTLQQPKGLLDKLDANPNQPSCYISGIIASDVLDYSPGIDTTESPCQ